MVVDGEVVFFEPMDQHQDPIAPFSPIGISAPSVLNKEKAAFARNELQRLVSLLEMRFGDFNVEYIYDKQGVFYLLEVGPRGGGNLIPDVILNGTGLDLRKISVRLALGEKVKVPVVSGYCANVTSFIIHSQTDGKYSRLKISPEIEKAIVFIKLFVKPGDLVRRFSGGIHALGFCILKFDNHDEMLHFMDNTTSAFNVITTD